MSNPFYAATTRWLLAVGWTFGAGLTLAQPAPGAGTPVPLNDLSAFVNPASNWHIVGSVRADLAKTNTLLTDKGTGVLVSLPSDKKNAKAGDLTTQFQHSDADIELDFMLAKGANSGVYLQGRYEIQLADSWEVKTPSSGDNGSIYQRWDDKRPAGQNGYEGHPARQNASRAPGLWQHLKASFQAPRFNAQGQKTENAKLLNVELNGVLIHDNVELSGPTRGAISNDEKTTGPLVLQGDHGAVAFRNIRYIAYDKPRPELVNLTFAVYKGKYEKEPEYDKTAPESEGPTTVLSSSVSRIPNEMLIRYKGTLRVAEPGEYRFRLGVPGGAGSLKIGDQMVVPLVGWVGNGTGKVTLPKGDIPVELFYSKFMDWVQPALGLSIAGPGVREFVISDATTSGGEEVDPILVDASGGNTILRSFMDVPGESTRGDIRSQGKRTRVTHAISVGSPDNVHYTYDMDKGALVQVWRGQFLDTTPMWHDRGDGSSRPMGMVQRMGTPMLFLAKLPSGQANWATDTTGTGYRPKGYVLDNNDRPTFRYQTYGSSVDDKIRVLEQGQGLQRELTVTNPAGDLYARLASGSTISAMDNNMYLIDGQEYIRIDDLGGAKPTIRESAGGQELIVPVKGKLTYSILF
ncbi:DUF1080 domain-containing protein [uncultured Spirosoma sp.]|uniref:3-keto-disaccharide hydrolase n=1 Tax=uncultured Spirosoma sp. TaxID=278208 RepID=UPI00258353F6|nr:DUF1080 domain-containing protein [uncultured Spirosoma sp.]